MLLHTNLQSRFIFTIENLVDLLHRLQITVIIEMEYEHSNNFQGIPMQSVFDEKSERSATKPHANLINVDNYVDKIFDGDKKSKEISHQH